MNEKPKFSILMPVYNEENHLNAAIDSVLLQTERDFELIVINDGSIDNTLLICKKYAELDNRVQVIDPGKVGKTEAFNIGYKSSKGMWVVFLAGDDLLPTDSLENRYKKVSKVNPVNSLIGGYGQLLTFSDEKNFNEVKMPKKGDKGYPCGGTLFLSKALAAEIFPIPTTLPNEDLWTSLFISFRTKKIIQIPKVVIHYRIHSGNSASRFEKFDEKNISIHKRFNAYRKFLEMNYNKLDPESIKKLDSLVKAEEYRFNNSFIKILLLKNLSLFNKLKFSSLSNKHLYNLRMRFYRFFSGWEN
ncbi:glycosyltransferase [Virgibacillus halodenitrificans]|nr:glycosyltransferase [Virgibacillus halodenitrificans]